MKFIKKIKQRFISDNIATFFYRILFFIFRCCMEMYDLIIFKILKLKLITTGRYIIKEINKSKMNLNLCDPGISRDLLMAGIREPTHTKFMKDILKKGDTIIDIGANIGYYALMESRIIGEKGKVYAVEPILNNIFMLKKNINLNNYKNIEVFNVAIGGENKKDYIYLSKKSNWCTLINNNKKENLKNKIVTEVVTLDKFIQGKRFPDLIRMDVEGYEKQIIEGMKNILNMRQPLKIFMELHCCFLPDLGLDILRQLEKKDFKIKLFFRDQSTLMLNKGEIIKNIYSYLGKKINGVYEFIYNNINVKELEKIKHILKEEVFHVYLERK